MHEPSVRRLLRSVDSHDLSEWIAEYQLRAEEADPDRPPTEDELSAKLAAFAAAHNQGGS